MKFDFYVINFDTHLRICENQYAEAGLSSGLYLNEAMEAYDKAVKSNPKSINTMLGVNLETDNGCISIDLLQRIDGKISLSEDYKKYPSLSKKCSIIVVNAINSLKERYEKGDKENSK